MDLDLSNLSRAELEELLTLIEASEERISNNLISTYFTDTGPNSRDNYPKHTNFFAAGKDYLERVLFGGNRVGKAQPINELVLTPKGYTEIGTLKLGDKVIGSKGKPVDVIGVYQQGIRPTYRISFVDGSSVLCDKEHLWTFAYSGRGTYQTKTLEEWSKIGKSKHLPQRPAVEFDNQEVPIDPYLLGLLIGDGGLSGGGIKITNIDENILRYCREIAPIYDCTFKRISNTITYSFSTNLTQKEGGSNKLLDKVRDLHLNCTSHHKYIPECYLHNSIEVRHNLLQGLMDTDGFISKKGRGFFNTVSKELAYDFLYLAKSLGINARIKRKKLCYEVYLPFYEKPMSRLPRKANRQTKIKKGFAVAVKDIKYVGEFESVCIEVDSEDHLYVTKDFVLTHNTSTSVVENTFHATGQYPSWWKGKRFDKPVLIWEIGVTAVTTRDAIQEKFLGRRGQEGTGLLPKDSIVSYTSKSNVPGAVQDIYVRHVSGGLSQITFKSYESAMQAFMGVAVDVVHLDEEPPADIYDECMMRVLTTNGIMMSTFTPLQGFSTVVKSFLTDSGSFPDDCIVRRGSASKYVVRIEWDDVPEHQIPQDYKDKMLASMLPHMRDARSKGLPCAGTGMVWPVSETDFVIPPFDISKSIWYKRCFALDIGWHRTAALFAAYDESNDIVYVYDEYYASEMSPIAHAAMLRQKTSGWIPGVIDPASRRSREDGYRTMDEYIDQGLELYPADNSVDTGILKVYNRLMTGKLRVFANCQNLLNEIRQYAYDDRGNIKGKSSGRAVDHLCDCLRYLIMSGLGVSAEYPDIDKHNDSNYVYNDRDPITGY